MLPAVLAITHTLTTYYIFSGLAVNGLTIPWTVVVTVAVYAACDRVVCCHSFCVIRCHHALIDL